jgi:hypothetical protein
MLRTIVRGLSFTFTFLVLLTLLCPTFPTFHTSNVLLSAAVPDFIPHQSGILLGLFRDSSGILLAFSAFCGFFRDLFSVSSGVLRASAGIQEGH